jgi:branched-chain amino acid aminotransferase
MSVINLCAESKLSCESRPLPISEFLKSDEIIVTSIAGGIMPVSRIGKTILSNDRPGAVSSYLRKRYWEKRAEVGMPLRLTITRVTVRQAWGASSSCPLAQGV